MYPPGNVPSGARSKVVERCIGGVTAPVAGSGSWPAWTASVSKRIGGSEVEREGQEVSDHEQRRDDRAGRDADEEQRDHDEDPPACPVHDGRLSQMPSQ